MVSPCYLPDALAGPYWVLDVGKYSDGSYQWAIVSGGQPREVQDDGLCTTDEAGLNSGLWILSRERELSTADLDAARSSLERMGVSTSMLVDVEQQGCLYEGAKIKTGDDDDAVNDDDMGLASIDETTSASISGGASPEVLLEWDLLLFNSTLNTSGLFELTHNTQLMLLQASLNDASVLASYDVQSRTRGSSATMELVDLHGDEVLYSTAEAHKSDASSVVRWRGDEVVTVTINEAVLNSNNNDDDDADRTTSRFDGALVVLGTAFNTSGVVEFSDSFDSMSVHGTVNDMAAMAAYDVRPGWRGSSLMMEFLDWSGDEVLLVDGRTKSSNASALVRWNNKKVLSFSQSLVLSDVLPSTYVNLDDFLSADDDIPEACVTLDRELEDFDLDEYTRASWYVQQQQVNPYQRRRDLYCVVATYDADQKYSSTLYVPPDNFDPIGVYNYANRDEVNSDDNTPPALCGRETNRA